MKITKFLISSIALPILFADASDVSKEVSKDIPEDVGMGHLNLEQTHNEGSSEPQFVNIDVTYDILEKPGLKFDQPLEFSAEEFATFNFTVKNNEDYNLTVIGISGNVVSNPGGLPVANITAQSVGPYEIPINGTLYFQTAIQLILPEGAFFVAPFIGILKDENAMRLGIRPLSVFVLPPAMSFFNPGFLSVQIIMGLLIAGITYLFMNSNKRVAKRSKTPSKPNVLDESWLPNTHKK